MEKRIGSILIIIESKDQVQYLNETISSHADIVIGRVGLPSTQGKVSLISLILEGTSDRINSLAGKLGKLQGIQVKSMVMKY